MSGPEEGRERPGPAPGPPAPPPDGPAPTALFNVVAAQASLIAALMFYLGVIYTSAYYGYFRLSPFSLGLGFAEYVLQSLNLLTFPVLVGSVLLVIVIAVSGRRPRQALPGPLVRGGSGALRGLARCYPAVVGAGLVLLVLWWGWQILTPYRWLGPLLIGIGLLLGEVRRTKGDRAPRRLRETAVAVFAAGLFLLWSVTLAAAILGERHAADAARHVVRSTGLVVMSAQRLGLAADSPELRYEDLGKDVHFRYRYTGLRLVAAREGRYYAVPIGWTARTGHVYVLRETAGMRVELTPGVEAGR
jgi:hypothetical protein